MKCFLEVRSRAAPAFVIAATLVGATLVAPHGTAKAFDDAGSRLVLPIPPRTAPVVASTGTGVIVFGGQDVAARNRGVTMPRNDGASYDLDTRRWRTIASAPFRPALLRPSGVMVDGTLVVAGTLPGGVAVGAYRPDTDTWRTLSAPPASRADTRATIVGARGGGAVVRVGADRLWLLDVAADRWTPLPDPPLTERICLAGQRLVAIAAERPATAPDRAGTAVAVTQPRQLLTATLSVGGGWTAPEAVPIHVADAACGEAPDVVRLTGGRLIRVGAEPRTGAVTLTVGDAASTVDPAWTDLVRRIDGRQQLAAGPTAWFHQFNMAGITGNDGGRAPADAVVYIVRANRNKPFAIALNEICIDWTNPKSQARIVQDALGKDGYTLVAHIAQTRTDDDICPMFGNALLHIGNHHPYPRTFQYWYADAHQAPGDLGKDWPERRGGVCARVNAFWVFFACSSHLTASNEEVLGLRYRLFQSAFFYNLNGPWDDTPPDPDIDPAIPAIRAGDLNSEPGSPEMSGWESDTSPWVEGDDALNRATSDSGRKIDYIFASHTTGYSAAEVSQDLGQSDHRYYAAVFQFSR